MSHVNCHDPSNFVKKDMALRNKNKYGFVTLHLYILFLSICDEQSSDKASIIPTMA